MTFENVKKRSLAEKILILKKFDNMGDFQSEKCPTHPANIKNTLKLPIFQINRPFISNFTIFGNSLNRHPFRPLCDVYKMENAKKQKVQKWKDLVQPDIKDVDAD